MAKAFSVMKTNVGTNVQDTSTAMATIIGVYLNDAYLDISERVFWSALIDNNYTQTATAGTATYDFPTSFDQEVFVANITQGYVLKRYNEGKWWTERATKYQAGSISRGTSVNYIILEEESKIQLDPAPDAADVFAIPYKKTITALSLDANTVVIRNIERCMELYATGQAFAYKKQFQKADWYLQRYEYDLRKRIGQERSKINQLYQNISATYRVPTISRLTGDLSYDSV